MKIKKLLSIFLAVIMVLGVCPVMNAFAAESEYFTEGIFTYRLIEGEAEIMKCISSAEGDIVIPATTEDGYKVAMVCVKAFENCANITEIKVGENVRFMRNNPFPGCSSLARFTVDENNKYYSADEYGVLFTKEKTRLIAYPGASVMEHYVVPDTVVAIDAVFDNCRNLKTLTIPESVEYRNNCDFVNCPKLTDIYFGGIERSWTLMDGGDWETGEYVTVHWRDMTFLEKVEQQLNGLGSILGPIMFFGFYFIIGIPYIPVALVSMLWDWIKSIGN